jgi:hypothetical protein
MTFRRVAVAAGALVERRPTLCASLLLLALLALSSVDAYDNTLTYDEPVHLAFGAKLLDGGLEHADSQRMPISVLNALPQRALRSMGVAVSPRTGVWLSRLPTVIGSALLGWFIFGWSRRLYGPRGGLLSLFLFAFCPTSLAHGSLATTDMYGALFAFLAVLTFTSFMKIRSWPSLLVAAAIMGVAQLAKQTALLLFPVLLMALSLRHIANRRARRADYRPERGAVMLRGALQALAYFAIVLGTVNAGYGFKGTFETLDTHQRWLESDQGLTRAVPRGAGLARRLNAALGQAPLPLPRVYVETFLVGQYYNDTGRGHGPIYLLGNLSQLGWRAYFPVAFVLKTPLPTLGLILLAVFVSLRTGRARLDSDELLILCSAAILLGYFSLFCTAQIGIRYLLPVLPFLYVLAGQCGSWSPPGGRRYWRACLVTLLLWLPISVLSYLPHHISYFNEVCWNRLHLYQYLADSNLDWGQDGYALDRYLELHKGQAIAVNPANPTTGTVVVAVNSLVGVTGSPHTFQWLRDNYLPTARAAYSWLVYEIPPSAPR